MESGSEARSAPASIPTGHSSDMMKSEPPTTAAQKPGGSHCGRERRLTWIQMRTATPIEMPT